MHVIRVTPEGMTAVSDEDADAFHTLEYGSYDTVFGTLAYEKRTRDGELNVYAPAAIGYGIPLFTGDVILVPRPVFGDLGVSVLREAISETIDFTHEVVSGVRHTFIGLGRNTVTDLEVAAFAMKFVPGFMCDGAVTPSEIARFRESIPDHDILDYPYEILNELYPSGWVSEIIAYVGD